MYQRAVVIGRDAHGRVRLAGRRSADQQWQLEALARHLGSDEAHLVEARRNQAGEPDDVHVLGLRRLQDAGGGRHHAEIDDLVVVALEHDADDVLADVVDIALDGGEQHLAGG